MRKDSSAKRSSMGSGNWEKKQWIKTTIQSSRKRASMIPFLVYIMIKEQEGKDKGKSKERNKEQMKKYKVEKILLKSNLLR